MAVAYDTMVAEDLLQRAKPSPRRTLGPISGSETGRSRPRVAGRLQSLSREHHGAHIVEPPGVLGGASIHPATLGDAAGHARCFTRVGHGASALVLGQLTYHPLVQVPDQLRAVGEVPCEEMHRPPCSVS